MKSFAPILKAFSLIIFLSLLGGEQLLAQSGLQQYTPSVMLMPGQWQVKNNSNFYVQTKQFGPNGGKVLTGRGRETYYTLTNEFLYGFSNRLNIGFDVWLKSVNLEYNPSANRTAITGVGPTIKFSPARSPGFSIQSTVLFPLADNLEGDIDRAYLENDRVLWLTELYYDLIVAPDFQIFTQLSFWYSFVKESARDNNFAQTPLKLVFNYLPTDRWTAYFNSELWPIHYNTDEQNFAFAHAYYVQAGLGVRYQIIKGRLEADLQYSNYLYGSLSQGAGESLNIGFRLLK